MKGNARPGTRWLARAAYGAGVLLAILLAAVALAPRAPTTAPDAAPATPGATIVGPSGLAVTLIEARNEVQDDGTLWLRLRFLAPWIAEGEAAIDLAIADMAYLCAQVGLPTEAERIVVSFSAAEVALGETAPGVVQFFEVYRPQGDDCIWEEF